ncbi:hypothetical protein ACFQJD_08780 [Haloplanus sp. GCM10025708]|uniref:hypothetical protein n=1 Tax=Haloferacaceae TaxID=1644056 RepID=UPI00360B0CE6
MTLRLTTAITDGSRRILTRTGGVLFALMLAHQALLVASLNTVLAARIPPEAADVIGLTLPVSEPVAGVLLIGALLFSAVYFVVLSRAFARPIGQLSSFPSELYTRRLGRATLTMLVVGVVVSLAVTIGFFLFFLPGLFLAACFLFVIFSVGVEDRGVVEALKRSWSLSRGNRLRLGVIVLVTGLVGSLVGALPAVLQMAGRPALGDLVSVLFNGVVFIFVYGVMASAYLQVAESAGSLGDPGASATANAGGAPEL